MGTDGTIQITVGDDVHRADRLWYREPPRTTKVTKAGEKKKENLVAGATMVAGGGANGPIPIMTSATWRSPATRAFVDREMKFARRWLYYQGRDGAGRAAQSGGY